MFDSVYDFFFGDQLRKHVVLISALFLGYLSLLPLSGWLDLSQTVLLVVIFSFISIWPLSLLYDRFTAVRRLRTQELIQEKVDVRDAELIMSALHQIEHTLHDMASIKHSRLPVNQTARDIILDFVKDRTLSQKFLQDYENLRAQVFHGVSDIAGQTDPHIFRGADASLLLGSARDLLTRLHVISYANEKTIHELSLNFERVMLRNIEVLKQAEVSAEAIGRMVAHIQVYLRQIEEVSSNEVNNLIAQHKKTT